MTDKNETAWRGMLEQAEEQGDADAAKRTEKLLAAGGYEKAAKRRKAAAKGDEESRSRAPQGRSTPTKQTAEPTKSND